MKLYTIQMSQWRKAQALGIPFLDTTVKSGDPTFAPSWEIVTAYKQGRSLHPGLSPEESYTINYKELMRQSLRQNRSRWLEVIQMDQVAIACYCGYYDQSQPAHIRFCHRHILCELLSLLCAQQGVAFEYAGEIGHSCTH